MTEKPDYVLATKIVEELSKREILKEEKEKKEWIKKLSEETLSVEDWKLFSESRLRKVTKVGTE